LAGVQFIFSGAEAELTNWVPVWDFDPGAPLVTGNKKKIKFLRCKEITVLKEEKVC